MMTLRERGSARMGLGFFMMTRRKCGRRVMVFVLLRMVGRRRRRRVGRMGVGVGRVASDRSARQLFQPVVHLAQPAIGDVGTVVVALCPVVRGAGSGTVQVVVGVGRGTGLDGTVFSVGYGVTGPVLSAEQQRRSAVVVIKRQARGD